MSPSSGLAFAVLAAATGWLGLRWFEGVNLYIPSRQLTFHPRTFGLEFEELALTAADGVKLHGWFVPGEPGAPTLLFFHGNAGNISNRLEKLRILHALGLSVLLFDYRGYGRSGGRPTERGTYRDAEAAWRYLTVERGVAPGDIVLYGESLGCGVAVETALTRAPRAVVLDSAFTSTADMGRLIFPFLPVDAMIRYRYDNLAKIGRVAAPVLVLHSREDDIVPFEMGRRLFAAARGSKAFVELRGDHNEGFLQTGAAYPDGIRSFLEALSR